MTDGPTFRLQIIDRDGHVVVNPFTGGGPMERELVTRCVEEVVARGVGLFRTEAHVAQDVRDGVQAAIQGLKDDTRYVAKQYR